MKTKLKPVLRVFVAIPTIGVGIAWILSHNPQSIFFKLACALVIFGAILVWQIGRKYTKGIFSIAIIMWAYPLGELVLHLKSPPQYATGYNKESAVPDPVRGYRWTAKEIRYFKTADGETVFDNYFTTNEQGWVMNQDYQQQKPKAVTKRWMLFGDSFSTGIMLDTNLPNRIQENMDRDTLFHSEMYSFAVDGGGIVNWYQTFFKEIIPNYEFDGVVIAVFEDNLYRDLMVQQIKPGNSFLGRTDSLDWSVEVPDFGHFASFDRRRLTYDDETINRLINNPPKAFFNWPLKTWLYRLIKPSRTPINQQRTGAKNIDQLKRKLGVVKFNMLDDILTWCIQNEKQVILTSVPSRALLSNKAAGSKNWHQQEMELISENWGANYFDGYNLFEGDGPELVDKYWFKSDGHWNQMGSDLYANSLVKFIKNLSGISAYP